MNVEASPRLWARVAGVSYLLTIITGVFAEVFVRGELVVWDNPAATAANILAHESLYRLGLAADLIMLLSYVVVTLLFYLLFKPAGRSLSMLAALFSLVGIAVLAVNCLNHYAPLIFLKHTSYVSGFQATQLQALTLFCLKLHARGYSIAGVFFGAYCVAIGYLTFRAGFLPRFLGVLMAIGGFGYLASSFVVFLSPPVASRLPDFTVLGGIAELSLTLWLTFIGVNTPRWQQKSSGQDLEARIGQA